MGDASIGEERLERAVAQKAAAEAVRARCKMATSDSKAPLRTVKRVQFGILSPDEIVSSLVVNKWISWNIFFLRYAELFHHESTLCDTLSHKAFSVTSKQSFV